MDQRSFPTSFHRMNVRPGLQQSCCIRVLRLFGIRGIFSGWSFGSALIFLSQVY
jgi:hypothetical protein